MQATGLTSSPDGLSFQIFGKVLAALEGVLHDYRNDIMSGEASMIRRSGAMAAAIAVLAACAGCVTGSGASAVSADWPVLEAGECVFLFGRRQKILVQRLAGKTQCTWRDEVDVDGPGCSRVRPERPGLAAGLQKYKMLTKFA